MDGQKGEKIGRKIGKLAQKWVTKMDFEANFPIFRPFFPLFPVEPKSAKKTPRTEGGDKVQAVSTQSSRQVLAFPVPKILEFVAFRDSGFFLQQFSRDFPKVLLGKPGTDPGNSHSLLEFSETTPDPRKSSVD